MGNKGGKPADEATPTPAPAAAAPAPAPAPAAPTRPKQPVKQQSGTLSPGRSEASSKARGERGSPGRQPSQRGTAREGDAGSGGGSQRQRTRQDGESRHGHNAGGSQRGGQSSNSSGGHGKPAREGSTRRAGGGSGSTSNNGNNTRTGPPLYNPGVPPRASQPDASGAASPTSAASTAAASDRSYGAASRGAPDTSPHGAHGASRPKRQSDGSRPAQQQQQRAAQRTQAPVTPARPAASQPPTSTTYTPPSRNFAGTTSYGTSASPQQATPSSFDNERFRKANSTKRAGSTRTFRPTFAARQAAYNSNTFSLHSTTAHGYTGQQRGGAQEATPGEARAQQSPQATPARVEHPETDAAATPGVYVPRMIVRVGGRTRAPDRLRERCAAVSQAIGDDGH